MGKASRWLRGLLGSKKPAAPAAGWEHSKPAKEKRSWRFARSFRDMDQHLGGVAGDDISMAVDGVRMGASYGEEGAPPRSCAPYVTSPRVPPPVSDNEDEQNKRAIAVAAATAAVAEAAVAAAQAALSVVKLTSSGRCPGQLYGSTGRIREWAAVRIQAAFRGYLARRALRALRGLVKLQALVRGHIVRKRAAETLRCMQALATVQARALSENRRRVNGSRRSYPVGTCTPEPRLGSTVPQKFDRPARETYVKRDSSSSPLKWGGNLDFVEPDRAQPCKWWERRMEERRCVDTRGSPWRTGAAADDERNVKILEVDTGKPHCSSTPASELNGRSFAAVHDDSPSRNSYVQFSVPSPASVDMLQQHPLCPLRFAPEAGEAYGESPQVYSASSRRGSGSRGPFTPAKSECARSFFGGYSDYPNYMANTESSRAKLRSQSAPKHRPDVERLSALRRVQVVGTGCGLSMSSSSQKSAASLHHKFTSRDYPGSGRLDRMGMPVRY